MVGQRRRQRRCGRSGIVAPASLIASGAVAWRLRSQGSAAFAAPRSGPQIAVNQLQAAPATAVGVLPEAVQGVGAWSGNATLRVVPLAVGAGLALLGHRQRRIHSTAGTALGGTSSSSRGARVACQGLRTGIVGLPNVGKSTMFNALCGGNSAEAANFPFCTIDPNIGKARVPDKRLDDLAAMAKSEKVVHEYIEYVDIAGLVKGASKGEGLGNKFLGNIRNVDAIVHVVRCFEDDDITHVDGNVNPVRDVETIMLELIFSDADQIEKRLTKLAKDVRNKVKGAAEEQGALLKIKEALELGKPARTVKLTDEEQQAVKGLGMITMKPMLFAANVPETDLSEGNDFVRQLEEYANEMGDEVVIVSAATEAELKSLDPEERAEFLEALGVDDSGCNNLIRATYNQLGLRTYFTCGPTEAHAWTIREGWLAPKAAGVIHTDFEQGFIKAEAIGWKEFLECGSEEEAKKKGKMRIEGKEYAVQEGDVMHFRFRT